MSGDVLQTPTILHSPVELSCPVEEESIELGQLSGDGRLVWRVVDNTLVVNNTSTGQCVQLWRPGNHGNIRHVIELDLHFVDGPLLMVVVRENNRNILAVLSPATSKLIRAVAIPFPVTVVHPLSVLDALCADSGGVTPGYSQQAQLLGDSPVACFSGVVAVGGNGGLLLLIDLHLNSVSSAHVSMMSPSQLQLLEGDVTMEEIQSISESGRHACIQLTLGGEQFVYQQKVFPSKAVKVTSLHFVSQLLCLFVGYSFGGFQIYDVSTLNLLYSSVVPQVKPLPAVTHFAFIEPDHDPRSFVYVWVARGASDIIAESTNSETKLILYQMIFTEKHSPTKMSRVAYRNFQSCGPRMEYALTSTPSLPNPLSSVGTRLLKCVTPVRYHNAHGAEEHELDMSVSVFVWACGPPGQRDYIIGLFDINQWYHAQMPNVLRWRRSGRYTGVLGSSYFAFFSIKPAMEATSPDRSAEIMDVCVHDLIPFVRPPPVPESHMWPTAMQFDFKALSSTTVLSCQFQGLPKSCLHELDVCRGVLFTQPERVFNMCAKADLLPAGWEHSVQVVDLKFQRQALLGIAVDYGCPYRVMTSLAESWLGSEVTDPLIMEWASSKMAAIVQQKNELCIDVSGGSPQEVLRKSLWCQLSSIQQFLEKILSRAPEDGYLAATFTTLSDLFYTAIMHKNLLDALSYFTGRGVDSALRPFSYPYATLSMRYDFLRKEHGDTTKLIVDYVCEDLEEIFEQPYPPVSLETFLDIFLTPHVTAQHFMMIYMMCDLVSDGVLSDNLIGEYGRSHDLPCELVAVSRGLWALDNQKYKDEQFEHDMKLLITSLDGPLFPWQHHAVCSALLSTNEIPLALLYVHHYGNQMQTTEGVKLRVDILVRGNRLNDACKLLTQCEGSQDFDELFHSFLENCYNAKNLHLILECPFDGYQEELLVNYLEQHSSLVVKEMAVFYFLLRHDYVEALKIHKRIKPIAKSHPDPRAMQRCSDRELLLAGFYSAIPTPLHQVLESDSKETGSGVTIRAEPQSTLSSVVAKELHTQSGRVGTQAGVIYGSLQAIAIKRNKDVEPMTPFRRPREKPGQAPFLSTPVSVKKARIQGNDSIRLLTPAPKHSLSLTPGISATPSNLQMKLFQEHMKSFKEKMAVFNDSRDGNLDVQTPLSSPKGSSYFASSLRTVSTPPSILKIKNPGASITKPAGSETKKIRFAPVEGPQVTPFLDKTTRRVPVSFTPAQPSSLATASSVAVQTPLPSSDDSDLFQSPLQSPSDFNDATTVSSLSMSVSTGPSLSLSTSDGDTNTTALEEATVEMETVEMVTDERQDKEVTDSKMSEAADEQQTARNEREDAQSAPMFVASEQQSTVSDKQATPSSVSMSVDDGQNTPSGRPSITRTATATTASQSLKELMSQLTRKTMSSPLTIAQSGHISSSYKSTPSLSSTTVATISPLVSMSSAAATKTTSTFFSPIPMLDDLIAAKHRKLKRSLEESKQQELARIAASPTVEQQKTLFSTIMVQQTKTSVESTSTSIKASSYSFSHAEMLADSPHPPPTDSTDPASFVFSPPLTRSAARRLRSSRETSVVSEDKQPEEEEPATSYHKKRGRGRPRKSTSSTPERSIPDPVKLVSPPSHQATPTLIPKQPRRPARKTRTAKSDVGTRRSTRLLMGKK